MLRTLLEPKKLRPWYITINGRKRGTRYRNYEEFRYALLEMHQLGMIPAGARVRVCRIDSEANKEKG